ncbi:MAG: ATP-binding cassette domain-containing protein [Candidatus Nanopelagicales bacterium]|nr:ATP-binding cassette domain-containing protein [Candidatus Nanopelagicales bacterium]
MANSAVVAEGLVKTYGDVKALDGLDLEVKEQSVLGLLGPNGAGKTTAVRILTTLLRPNAGHATVGGIDVLKHPEKVRAIIGLTGQYAAVDEYLTGRENINMVGQLYHLEPKWVRKRADELLERFRLADAADRPAKTYSGGMRRRLDLASSLVAKPEILFLDEPTTGLDPRSRLELWEVIENLVADGTTVLLTTQYLEEADQLAEEIVVIDHGKVIAKGTSETLKDSVGGDRVEVVVREQSMIAPAVAAISPLGNAEAKVDEVDRRVTVPVSGGSTVLVDVVRSLDSAGVVLDDLALRRPTLDDVFLSLTGRTAEEEEQQSGTKKKRRQRKQKEAS